MKEKDKNSKDKLSDLLRYNSDNLSGSEKNSIEREFQKDPFAGEAAEGFSTIGNDEAISDIHSLERRLSSRISRGKRVVWYSIAASVAIIMTVSSLYFLLNREKTMPAKTEIALNTITLKSKEPKDVAIPEKMQTEATDKKARSEEPKSVPAKDIVSADEAEFERSEMKEVEPYVAASVLDTMVPAQLSSDSVLTDFSSRAKAAAPEATGIKWQMSEVSIKGRVISADDSSPVAGATIIDKSSRKAAITDLEGKFSINIKKQEEPTLIASYIGMETKEFKAKADTGLNVVLTPSTTNLNEVVVVGYGVSNKDNAEEETVGTDNQLITPEPEGGRKAFDAYIKANIIKPASSLPDKRRIVVIKFTVSRIGAVQNLVILKTPGEDYSSEAKRLILQGPKWKPATRDGEPVDDDVTIRVLFK